MVSFRTLTFLATNALKGQTTMQLSDIMHPRIAELARVLLPMIENPVARPTLLDRSKLTTVRDQIKRLPDEKDINLSDRDETDRQYLYVESTRLANRQEDFFEENGDKWEPMTKAQLIAMGGDAPLDDDLVNAFPVGNLNSFAEKELPGIRRALRVRTLGALATRTRSEIAGPQARNAGNKTLEWIDAVCREFNIEPPKHSEPAIA
ncbi:MAG TPA: hypothetical protein VHD31_02930 [Candidatus Paceibacterota bacterium]|nr:hypothetical protein [Candidatus Paceibacterota bacterium]